MSSQKIALYQGVLGNNKVSARFTYESAVKTFVLSVDEFQNSGDYIGSFKAELSISNNIFFGSVVDALNSFATVGTSISARIEAVAGTEMLTMEIGSASEKKEAKLTNTKGLLRTLTIFHDKEPALYLSKSISELKAIDLQSRTHSLESIFKSASIELKFDNVPSALPADHDATWTAAELLVALKARMPALRSPWSIWLFEGTKYEDDSVHGILIKGDKNLKESRKGCAIFSGAIEGVTPVRNRKRLWTLAHEIGHCLNLIHTNRRNKPQGSACFMTDASSVTDSFWNNFGFEFNDDSLLDLHHSFYPSICPGESDFKDALFYARETRKRRNTDLQLEIVAESQISINEPLLLQLKLVNIGKRVRHVSNCLNPRWGRSAITIAAKEWDAQYEPMLDFCGAPPIVRLAPGERIRDFVWLHSNRSGALLPSEGEFSINAVLQISDKTWLESNTVTVRVSEPTTTSEKLLASKLKAENIRTIFEIEGSDCASLSSSMDFLKEIADLDEHRTASKCASILAINAGRNFKSMLKEEMYTRASDYGESAHWFKKAVLVLEENSLLSKFATRALNKCIFKMPNDEAANFKERIQIGNK